MTAVTPAEARALAQPWAGSLNLDPEVNTRPDAQQPEVDQEAAGAHFTIDLAVMALAGKMDEVVFSAPLSTFHENKKINKRFPTVAEALEESLELRAGPAVKDLIACICSCARDNHPEARALLGRMVRASRDQAVGKFGLEG